MGFLREGKPGLVECLFNGGASRQVGREGAREGEGILVRNAETHTQGIRRLLLDQGCGEVTQMRLSWGCTGTGVEGDQEDRATDAAHEVPGCHLVEIAIVLFKAEDGAIFRLPAVSHEMHNAIVLIRDKVTDALKRRRSGTFKGNGGGAGRRAKKWKSGTRKLSGGHKPVGP